MRTNGEVTFQFIVSPKAVSVCRAVTDNKGPLSCLHPSLSSFIKRFIALTFCVVTDKVILFNLAV